jgi:predicted NAD/FAD-binding protein
MGAAIWSSRPIDMLHFPARFFVEFFANHGFLSVNERPTWRVIRGGSREYVKRLTAPYAARIRLNTPVAGIQRQRTHCVVRLKNGAVESFDQVFIACHSDQALKLLSDPSREESEILGSIQYQANEGLLHTDTRLMPKRALACAGVAAQKRRAEISGPRRTFYCGAYWSYGFHEDGVKSALAAVDEFQRRQSYAKPHLQRVG